MAGRARAVRLLLTHYPASADVRELGDVARTEFAGPVDVVDDGFAIVLARAR
jgi:ribonuclease BN (tRNA processing enzyme)